MKLQRSSLGPIVCLLKKYGFNPVGRKSMKFFNLWKSLPELCFRKIILTTVLRID